MDHEQNLQVYLYEIIQKILAPSVPIDMVFLQKIPFKVETVKPKPASSAYSNQIL